MAMPKSTPRRPGNPGQNRDSRDGVFGHPESPGRPAPSRRPLRPRFDTASAHDQDAAAAAARVSGTPSLAGGPRCRRGRLRIQAVPGERPSTRRCAAARDRHHPERNLPISGPAGSLRVIFHTVAAHAPGWRAVRALLAVTQDAPVAIIENGPVIETNDNRLAGGRCGRVWASTTLAVSTGVTPETRPPHCSSRLRSRWRGCRVCCRNASGAAGTARGQACSDPSSGPVVFPATH